MDELSPNRRRWFQFRLRTLLVAALVLSMPLSWFAVKLERTRRQRKAVEVIESFGGGVTVAPSAPGWVRAIVGNDLFVDVDLVRVSSDEFGDDEAACLKKLTKLESLLLDGTQITNTELEHLKSLGNLKSLSLGNTQVTDNGLKHLRGMGSLALLYLDGTHVTDEGVEKLRRALPDCQIIHTVERL